MVQGTEAEIRVEYDGKGVTVTGKKVGSLWCLNKDGGLELETSRGIDLTQNRSCSGD